MRRPLTKDDLLRLSRIAERAEYMADWLKIRFRAEVIRAKEERKDGTVRYFDMEPWPTDVQKAALSLIGSLARAAEEARIMIRNGESVGSGFVYKHIEALAEYYTPHIRPRVAVWSLYNEMYHEC